MHALQPGDPAPDGTLPDEREQPRRLAELWQSGPLALFFLRHLG